MADVNESLFFLDKTTGVLEWRVIGKVTDYGQNVTLFCNVSNCCPDGSGWVRWTPEQHTLFIDVKTEGPNKHYDGNVLKDGYTLIIQNLTKQDLNVSYSCVYGVTLGERQFLLEEDVFTYISTRQTNTQTGKNRISEGQIAGIIVGVVILETVAVAVALFVLRCWRRRKKRNIGFEDGNENYANKVVPLIDKGENSSKKEIITETTITCVATMHVLTEVSKSVGYITGMKGSGTCWRVGNNKIITAAHVVKENIWNTVRGVLFEEDLNKFQVDFDYIIEKSPRCFKVEPRVLFMDESLDVAVLQLKPDNQKQFPPPLKMFDRLNSQQDEDKPIYLISHNKGEIKKVNSRIGIWDPTEDRIKDLEKVCQKYGKPNGYKDLDKKDRLVIQCEFVGGASGSPGIVIYNNVAYVVFVYIRGFPSFYYSQHFPEKDKRTFPREKLFQQGVNIGDLFDTMSKNAVHFKLCNEIFPEERKNDLNKKQHHRKQAAQNIEACGSDKCKVQGK
ncbi:unnamed protein product [Mytilus coruscus]|uniref:Ig-like domain-containing protein n=1 Tax=Mytilus coruscus TaxID=42192 RepID=A0A6J8E7G7_MYTCO|nr:unnamed protein product [Mytilus coruscus]